MKIILREDVEKVGNAGELINVKDGYARNFLIPRKLAVAATSKSLRVLEHHKRTIEAQRKKYEKTAQQLREKLENFSCTISKKVGENEKLFGTVTTLDIEKALRAEGFEIDKRQILLEEPIKSLGVYTVNIKLSKEVSAPLKVWVVEK